MLIFWVKNWLVLIFTLFATMLSFYFTPLPNVKSFQSVLKLVGHTFEFPLPLNISVQQLSLMTPPSNGSGIPTITKKVATISKEVDTITKKVDTIDKEVDTIDKEVNTITKEVTTSAMEVPTITKEVDTITKEVATITKDVATTTKLF